MSVKPQIIFSVTHFGPYPPTYGGVSVHIRRLHRALIKLGHTSTVIAPYDQPAFHETGVTNAHHFRRRCQWFLYPGVEIPGEIVHCHNCWIRMSLVLCRLLLRGKSLVITVHNQQDERRWNAALPEHRLFSRIIPKFPKIRWIAVSERVREQLLNRHVSGSQIEVIPAFLSPDSEDSNAAGLSVPLLHFLESSDPVFSIYGSKYDFPQGVDLYGFDMAVEAIASLKARYPRAGLLICVPGKYHLDYQSKLIQRATQLDCHERIFFLNDGVLEGGELWRRSSVHLRPTTTDGDSLAVREALALGVPVVASDAVPRPSGCVLFPSRNIGSFVEAIRTTLESPPRGPTVADALSKAHIQAILRQYGAATAQSCAFL